jgi:hypothetical protein
MQLYDKKHFKVVFEVIFVKLLNLLLLNLKSSFMKAKNRIKP